MEMLVGTNNMSFRFTLTGIISKEGHQGQTKNGRFQTGGRSMTHAANPWKTQQSNMEAVSVNRFKDRTCSVVREARSDKALADLAAERGLIQSREY